ncbi:glycosyltransferase [Bacteroidales bacterium OttesenSCG-928-I21]|nr:glycosyltransferase [Bacteroidales bacterium OttesenSCG-928-I21]
MENPLISVIMATFNEPSEQINKSIQSVLNQTFRDFELLIIDDSTKPETVVAIDNSAQSDSRVKVIRKPQRMGFAPALNIGLLQARGKYIARMDADDISMPDRFELQIAFLDKNPNIAIVGGAMDIINEKGEIVSHRNYPTSFFKIKLFSLLRSPLAHPTVMIRKESLGNELYDKSFKKAEDLELWLRMMKKGYKISNLPDILLHFRVNGNLADKRTKEHFEYNYEARKKNFSWRSPVWSFLSIFFSKIYIFLPKKIISAAYNIENNSVINYKN